MVLFMGVVYLSRDCMISRIRAFVYEYECKCVCVRLRVRVREKKRKRERKKDEKGRRGGGETDLIRSG